MADINLNDLLENRQSDEGAPKSYEKKELVNFNRQVETLTAEERQQVDTIKESINLVTANAIAQYGIAAQNNIASFSNSILSTIKSTDKTAAGDLLNDLVKKVHDFEEEQEGGKGFLTNLPVVGSLFKKVPALQQSYLTLSAQIDNIQAGLDKQKMVLMKDVAMFRRLVR